MGYLSFLKKHRQIQEGRRIMGVWKRNWVYLSLLLTVFAGCQESAPVGSLAGVRQTLDAAGVRLSQVKSERRVDGHGDTAGDAPRLAE